CVNHNIYIDMAGVIYNGKYLDIYNQARDEYLRDVGLTSTRLYEDFKCFFAVVEANIKYKQPIHYDEIIEIVTKVSKIGGKSLVFIHTPLEQRKSLQIDLFLICFYTDVFHWEASVQNPLFL
ncbi:MAG: thioesterase family protein, partial [Desulfobacterales bacterium]|nr:thioesterase family protein [Desulfobacterales bacterium]